MEVLYLSGALIEHFFEGSAPLTQKRRIVFVTLLIWVNVPMSLTEQFFQGNVPLMHLVNEETLFMC